VILVSKWMSEPFKINVAVLEVSWMANAFLQALSGSDGSAQGSCVGLRNRCTHRKLRPAKARPGSLQDHLFGEDAMTVCRPFMVSSRSRQPTLSTCNLSRPGVMPRLRTSFDGDCGGTREDPGSHGFSNWASRLPSTSIVSILDRSPSLHLYQGRRREIDLRSRQSFPD